MWLLSACRAPGSRGMLSKRWRSRCPSRALVPFGPFGTQDPAKRSDKALALVEAHRAETSKNCRVAGPRQPRVRPRVRWERLRALRLAEPGRFGPVGP